jgi:hypothetical protein
MSQTIDFYMHTDTARTLLRLLEIANKAHSFNPSPVDIKQELAELPADVLMQAEQDLKERIAEQTHIHDTGRTTEGTDWPEQRE